MKPVTDTHPADGKIMRMVRATKAAKAFSAKDFSRLGNPAATRKALERLTKRGDLRRIRRGFYDLPRSHPILGQTAPDPMELVRGIMRNNAAVWQVSGAYAANLLHLSEQVPAKIVILTDGVPRKVPLDKLTLDFRRAAPRNLLGAGKHAGLVFQALRHLGKAHVTPDVIARLRQLLDAATKADLDALAPDAPAWMRPHLYQITSSS
ncbi:MAG: hypothetical protein K1X42_14685 [Opitutaceae bacterium]|nr:hypothetical protein [Opitutaceae bacterium]